MSWPRFAVAVPLVLATTIALAGCAQAAPKVTPSRVPTPTPGSTSTAIPVYKPEGTAKQNLDYFRLVGHALLDNNPSANAHGKTIVNWFVAHGFDKANMQVTPDTTTIGLAAWNIEFSVKINGGCLIGQAGNVGFQSFAAPVLSTGKCLIGQTRPINW
ncbi:MAG TPA: hypothetical protein VHX87_02145 [Galbitalea sp.]|nr:hypothetical protein [Galbitalea sp.]